MGERESRHIEEANDREWSLSNKVFILVLTVVLKLPKSTAFKRSTMLGMKSKHMLTGLGSNPIQSSHSSVRTKVMRKEFVLDDNNMQRLIMSLMGPCNGKGTTMMWKTIVGSTSSGSM